MLHFSSCLPSIHTPHPPLLFPGEEIRSSPLPCCVLWLLCEQQLAPLQLQSFSRLVHSKAASVQRLRNITPFFTSLGMSMCVCVLRKAHPDSVCEKPLFLFEFESLLVWITVIWIMKHQLATIYHKSHTDYSMLVHSKVVSVQYLWD